MDVPILNAQGMAILGRTMNKLVGYIFGTVFVIALWWLLGAMVDSPALPTPDSAIASLVANHQAIVPEFIISFERLFLAMLIGTLIGAPIGLILGRSELADRLFQPVLYILYPIPKIVFLPVIFIFFGIGGDSKIMIIAIAIFFQMMVTMRDASKNIASSSIVSTEALGANRFQIFKEVVIPATLPDLFTALRVSTGTAVAILFIAESMAGSSGLGYYIMHSWSLLEYSQMFAGIIAMAFMGVAIYEAFNFIEKRTSHTR